MRKFWAVLLAVLCVTSVTEGTELRIMTYNIHHGEGTDGVLDLERIARIVLQSEAEVVCFQEVDRGLSRTDRRDFVKEFEALLEMEGVFGANYFFDDGEYGNATFSRLPIIAHENMALPGPDGIEPRGALRVTLDLEGQPIQVVNTHWGLTSEERAKQGAALSVALGTGPTLVVGDFNENERGQGLSRLFESLSDSAGAPRLGAYPTFPAYEPQRRIDFILHSKHFSVEYFSVLDGPEIKVASDHRPVMATVKLPAHEHTKEADGSATNESTD